MTIRICTQLPWASTEEVECISNAIDTNTSVGAFEEMCEQMPGFHYEDDGISGAKPALSKAADVANASLVADILKVRRDLVNRGDSQGFTALLLACTADTPRGVTAEQVYETALALLHHGADPNLVAKPLGHGSVGVTALWIATETREEPRLAQLLLMHGAQLGQRPLSPEGQAVLDQAREGQAQLVRAIAEGTDLIPPLCDIVTRYAGSPPSS